MRRPGTPPRHKYHNQPIVIDGVRFDSRGEAARWLELLRMQERGVITDLRRQVTFELAPAVRLLGAVRLTPALRYTADFSYTIKATGKAVVEDKKGMRTPVYRVKRHLMKALLGIDIVES